MTIRERMLHHRALKDTNRDYEDDLFEGGSATQPEWRLLGDNLDSSCSSSNIRYKSLVSKKESIKMKALFDEHIYKTIIQLYFTLSEEAKTKITIGQI